MALSTLGNLNYYEGNRGGALDYLQSALDKAGAVGEVYPIVRAALGVAAIAGDEGDDLKARLLLACNIRLADRVGNRNHLALALEGMTAFTAKEHCEEALRLARAAAAIRAGLGAPISPTERKRFDTRLALAQGREQDPFAAAPRDDGRSSSLDEAVRLALALCDSATEPQKLFLIAEP
jgi:hypothetical protein